MEIYSYCLCNLHLWYIVNRLFWVESKCYILAAYV
jgi:hypothetical protein